MVKKLHENSVRGREHPTECGPKEVQLKGCAIPDIFSTYFRPVSCLCTRFVQKVSGLTTVHEVDKAYGVLTLIVFNIVPFRSYTLRATLLPLLETFCKLLFWDV